MYSKSSLIQKIFKILPPTLTVLLIVCLAFAMKDLNLNQLLSFVPSNLYLCALVIILLYALKSLSIVFPISALYLMSGVIYTPIIAILVNILGMIASFTLPYLIGKEYGTSLIDGLTQKYPNVKKIQQMGISNDVILAYVLRIVTILPGDLCSLFLGSCRMRYRHYLVGSLMGFIPLMVVHVLLADVISSSMEVGLKEALTPQIILIMAVLVGVSIFSAMLFNQKSKRKNKPN